VSQTAKLQRWIDLVAALLDRHYGATLAELRKAVPGYARGRPESVRRTFERDKLELRRLGVPIDIEGDEGAPDPRYILKAQQFYMPYLSLAGSRGPRTPRKLDRHGYKSLAECDFSEDELAVLAEAAARVQQLGEPLLARDASRAVAKLAIDLPPDALDTATPAHVLPPRSRCDPATLTQLGDALLRRKQVSFTYYGIERDETERRTVLPYGLAYTSGHWYLHAQDTARGALRLFRISRIRELAINAKAPGTPDYGIPDGFCLAERVTPKPTWALGDEPAVEVTLRLLGDTGRIREARRHGTTARGQNELTKYSVRRREPFLRWVLGMAGDASPVAPPDLVREYHSLVQRTLEAAAP
jgi:proteasome accessory factor B